MLATAVAIAVRQLNIPDMATLLLAGLLSGLVPMFHPPHLTKPLPYPDLSDFR